MRDDRYNPQIALPSDTVTSPRWTGVPGGGRDRGGGRETSIVLPSQGSTDGGRPRPGVSASLAARADPHTEARLLSVRDGAQRAPSHHASRRVLGMVAAAVLVTFISTGVAVTPTLAASGVKVAIIVGPNGSVTATNRANADAAAREALRYTRNVVKVYSPNATWSRVKAAITGASIVIYFGRGYGYPSPHGSSSRRIDPGRLRIESDRGARQRDHEVLRRVVHPDGEARFERPRPTPPGGLRLRWQ